MVTNPEGGWDKGVVRCGHPHGQRPDRSNGGACWCSSRSSRRTSWTARTGSVRAGTLIRRSTRSANMCRRVDGGVRRGPEIVLRHDPPRCIDQVSGATDRRPLGAEADPHVAGMPPSSRPTSRDETNATRPKQGTPQGGVISPLLANLYLHWFEKKFYRLATAPATWAKAKLVRYADDFVVLARYQSRRLIDWIEGTARRTVPADDQPREDAHRQAAGTGAKPELSGFHAAIRPRPLRRGRRYLNVFPSAKAMARARDKLRELTGPNGISSPSAR